LGEVLGVSQPRGDQREEGQGAPDNLGTEKKCSEVREAQRIRQKHN